MNALNFIYSEIAKHPELMQKYKGCLENHLDEIVEDFDFFRICSCCRKPMIEGYCIEDGDAYYCSDECLHKNLSNEEYIDLYKNGEGNSYWTNWYEYADKINAYE